jgi:hypothetical protein
MRTIKSPSALAAHGASETDGLEQLVFLHINRQQQIPQAVIRAMLIGSNHCEAEGIIAHGYAPVLDLCRKLVAAGYNPASPLEAWRGETLCLRVRSIGESAGLTVADDKYGTPHLRRRQKRPLGHVAGSPVAQIADERAGVPTPGQPATWEAV